MILDEIPSPSVAQSLKTLLTSVVTDGAVLENMKNFFLIVIKIAGSDFIYQPPPNSPE